MIRVFLYRYGVTDYTVDKRTIRRALGLLEEEGLIDHMAVSTANPGKEDEMICTDLYFLTGSKPTEEQV